MGVGLLGLGRIVGCVVIIKVLIFCMVRYSVSQVHRKVMRI